MENIFISTLRGIIYNESKKIIIYGVSPCCYNIICYCLALDRKVEYIVDSQKNGGGSFHGYPIMEPDVLANENKEDIVILIACSEIEEVEKMLLEDYDLKKDEQVFDFKKLGRTKRCDLFDPFLGYSRLDDIEGFKIWKAKNEKLKIVILGNSTSEHSYSGLKSWPEFFWEEANREMQDVTVYDGAVIGYYSSQEVLKLIRDVISLSPDIVISFSGITDASFLDDVKYPLVNPYLKHRMDSLAEKSESAMILRNPFGGVGYGVEISGISVENWYKHNRIMHGVCNEFGIKFLGVLGPTIYLNYNISEIEKKYLNIKHKEEEIGRIKAFFLQAIKNIEVNDYMYDLTSCFNEMSGVFYDDAHWDEVGNNIIAKKVYEIVFN